MGGAMAEMVFIDPPYGEGHAMAALAALAGAGWIVAGTICVVESGASEEESPPPDFEILDDRRYGAARILFLRHGG